ncbi:MAG: hypothetical protein LBQ02_01545 [Candidatus Nomurabacteria bacterium]|jgi:hypothetical protein|nr:hypothetical protein [Candidatus Nomurabacteria bacterium]
MTNTSKTIAGLVLIAGFGVAALPLTSYAVERAVTINVDVADASGFETPTGTGASPCAASLNITPATIGTTLGHAKCDIRVSSNKPTGYVLSIDSASTASSADNTSNLVSGTNQIGPVTTAYAGTVAGGSGGFDLSANTSASAWGFNVGKDVANFAEDQTGYFAMPAAKTQVEATTAAGGAHYTISFGATVSTGQAQGAYVDVVTLTVE